MSLAPESRYITTFERPEKVHQIEFWYQFSEIFQNTISEQIRDIQGVMNISDDVIMFAKS